MSLLLREFAEASLQERCLTRKTPARVAGFALRFGLQMQNPAGSSGVCKSNLEWKGSPFMVFLMLFVLLLRRMRRLGIKN
jgi:hypothetical protein